MNFAYLSSLYKEICEDFEELGFSVVISDLLDFNEIAETSKLKITTSGVKPLASAMGSFRKIVIDLASVKDDNAFLNAIKK
ncbi:MAG: hypothetical protein LR001_08505 [Clostridiales bacterium]|nr:hypothetical protein [Clostridiales bacterium]